MERKKNKLLALGATAPSFAVKHHQTLTQFRLPTLHSYHIRRSSVILPQKDLPLGFCFFAHSKFYQILLPKQLGALRFPQPICRLFLWPQAAPTLPSVSLDSHLSISPPLRLSGPPLCRDSCASGLPGRSISSSAPLQIRPRQAMSGKDPGPERGGRWEGTFLLDQSKNGGDGWVDGRYGWLLNFTNTCERIVWSW